MKSEDTIFLESASTEDSFAAIGNVLRLARIDRGFAINDVVNELRYSKAYIRHLEDGSYDLLPGSTYVAGYLRSYSKLVGVDGVALIERYHRLINQVESKPDYAFPASGQRPQRSGAVIASFAVAIAAVGYVGWYWSEKPSMDLAPGIDLEQVQTTSLQNDVDGGSANQVGGELLIVNQPDDETLDQPIIAVSQDIVEDTSEVVPEAVSEAAPEIVTANVITEPTSEAMAQPTTDVAIETTQEATAEIAPEITQETTEITQEATQSVAQEIADGPVGIGIGDRSPDGGSAIATSRDPNNEITLRAVASSWVEIVRNDGEEVMTKLMRKGDTYLIDGGSNLYLSTGNAGGLELLFVDGATLSIGDTGEILRDLPLNTGDLRENL